MENITLILIGISVLFFLLLGIKTIFDKKKKKFCAICLSISLIWIFLLILYFLGKFQDMIILSLLIGGSIVGIFYLWENKVKKEKLVFRLPLLLTLIFIFYSLLERIIYSAILFLVILWIFFILIYLFKNHKGFNKFFKKIIECCKRW